MPKLRHIAIAAEDPEAMAEFYKKAFDFKEVGEQNGYLADGVFLGRTARSTWRSSNSRPISERAWISAASTISACSVEDVDEFGESRSLGAQPLHRPAARTATAGYFEKKFFGPPRSVLFDIAEHGWAGADRSRADQSGRPQIGVGRQIMAKLRHLAIAGKDPDAMAEFYIKAFDLKNVRTSDGPLA